MAAGGEGRDNHLGPVPPKLFRRHYIRASIFDRLNQTTNAFVLVQETQLARMQRCVMLTQVYSNICILYSEMDLLNKLMSRNLVVFFFHFGFTLALLERAMALSFPPSGGSIFLRMCLALSSYLIA